MPGDSEGGIVSAPIENYLYGLLRPRNQVLVSLEKDAEKNHVPIVGPLVGNLLSMIAMSCRAKNILEVGTATGYSGIWLGSVAKLNGGKLTTVEFDPARAKIASRSFKDAGLADIVEIVVGDAKELVPKLTKKMHGNIDVVFLDVGDKTMYVDLLEPLANSLRVGGFLIADNTLWGGAVADANDKDAETRTLRNFNKRVYADERFQPVIIPLRDGVTVAQKTREK